MLAGILSCIATSASLLVVLGATAEKAGHSMLYQEQRLPLSLRPVLC